MHAFKEIHDLKGLKILISDIFTRDPRVSGGYLIYNYSFSIKTLKH